MSENLVFAFFKAIPYLPMALLMAGVLWGILLSPFLLVGLLGLHLRTGLAHLIPVFLVLWAVFTLWFGIGAWLPMLD